ncbi:unnamed protein product [Laminaria digitata]
MIPGSNTNKPAHLERKSEIDEKRITLARTRTYHVAILAIHCGVDASALARHVASDAVHSPQAFLPQKARQQLVSQGITDECVATSPRTSRMSGSQQPRQAQHSI